eukprot:3217428-Rhodomonas_salina.1
MMSPGATRRAAAGTLTQRCRRVPRQSRARMALTPKPLGEVLKFKFATGSRPGPAHPLAVINLKPAG